MSDHGDGARLRVVPPLTDEQLANAARDEFAQIAARIRASILPASVREEVKAALEGDSNDAEHDALVAVAQALGIEYTPFDDFAA